MSHIFDDGIENAIARLESPERVSTHNPDVLFSKIKLSKGSVVADLGCGTGFFTIPASRLVGKEGKVIAVDNVPQVLRVLERKLKEGQIVNVSINEADVSSTRIESKFVDVVLMANIFHDVNKDSSLREVERISKPNGKLVILDWKKMETKSGPPLTQRLDPKDVVTILNKRGVWSITDQFEIGPTHYVVVAGRK